jgi:hypothetical protein
VAVQVEKARNGNPAQVLCAAARRASCHREHGAIPDADPHVSLPARGQQGVVKEKLMPQAAPSVFYPAGFNTRYKNQMARWISRQIIGHIFWL